jgi:metallo-beta-lactamase family protein
VDAGGNIIIPTFAVERAQELLYILTRLVHDDRIPQLLTFLDSPMAVSALDVFRRHHELMDDDAQRVMDSGQALMRYPGLSLIESRDESKAINRIRGSCIIMAGSGMCNAGRIKHHLARNISRPECTVLLTGYQAAGTLGRELVERRPVVRIHGAPHQVRARVVSLLGFSAHADHDGLLDWLGALDQPPRRIFLTHGEPNAANALAADLRCRFSSPVEIPAFADVCDLP